MSKSTHTPGPWQIEVEEIYDPYPIYGWPAERIGEILYLVIGDEKIELARDGYGHSDDKFKQKVAIAQTHIVAPDMLEALECQSDYNAARRYLLPPAEHQGLFDRWAKVSEKTFGVSYGEAALFCYADWELLIDRLQDRALAKAKGEADANG